MSKRPFVLVGVAASALMVAAMCERVGYTNRVLWRVPSPDGRLVAVCQEIPEFDGPSYDIRLESPEGAIVRRLRRGGDSQPCSEMAWSPDGGVLAILIGHVAQVVFLDVDAARRQPADKLTPWRLVSLSSERDFRTGRNLRFLDASVVEVLTCQYDLRETKRTRKTTCTLPEAPARVAVPL